MRKALKIGGIVVLALVALVGAFAGFVAVRGIPTYEPGHLKLRVESTPARVERGRKFAKLLCAECHMDPTTRQLTGKRMADAPAEFGPIVSGNITRDREHGIGSWTDGELVYLLRTGIRRDGQYIPPYMAKLPHMADEDVFSIIAFLRSDDPLVAPAAVDPPGKTQPSFLTKFLSTVAFKPLSYPRAPIARPDETDKIRYGRYLTVNLDCWTCHSADFKTMNTMEPEKTPGYLGGGNALLDFGQREVRSANLTFDAETGIGRWSEADFVRAVRDGVRPNGRMVMYPMEPLPELTPEDVSAMYAYLKTVPKLRNAVARATPPQVNDGAPGKRLYYQYGCYGCHGDNGVGVADLRQAGQRYPNDAALIAWIKNAPSQRPGTHMPKWEGIVKEEEFAPLAAYVRELGARR